MNILFITPFHFNLHKPIEKELSEQGHRVYTVRDICLQHDNGYKGKNIIKKYIDRIFFNNNNELEKHWINLNYQNNNFLEQKYDVCFCINGCSFCEFLYKYLKKRNPSIKFVLYLWDTINFFNYDRNFIYFDKIYSFDFHDSNNNSKVDFLPFYWIPSVSSPKIRYDISLIGSHHDGRLGITESIAKQLDEANLSYYFKIYCAESRLTLSLIKKILIAYIKRDKKTIRDIKIIIGKEKHPFITNSPIPLSITNTILNESECILDTDMEIQAGPTPRLIWALAKGKKIITTNSFISLMPFYDKNLIHIIERKNPKIDIDFIISKNEHIHTTFLDNLRIDNWVKQILNCNQ